MTFPALPIKDWAVDGSSSGTGVSRAVTSLGVSKVGQPAMGQEGKAQYIATKIPLMEREVRVEQGFCDDAETVVVAFGSPAKFVKYAIAQLREAGHRIGYVRPITLWPFPYEAVAAAAAGPNVRRVGSFELSAGQLVEDRLRLLRAGGVIEVNQRLAVDLLLEDRELGTHPANVERGAASRAVMTPGRRRSAAAGPLPGDRRW